MAVEEILYFLAPFVAVALIALGFAHKERFTGLFGAILLSLYGVVILINPLPVVGSLANDALGSVMWGYGSYLIIRTTYEQYSGKG